MKAGSLYLGLQCAQWNINHSSSMNTCLTLHQLRVSADLWQWHFWVHQKRGVLLVSLVNVKQGPVPIMPAAHQLWKYILSHQAWGQWCNIMQYIVKLKTETRCEYLSFWKAYSFFLYLRLETKTEDHQPRAGQRGGRGEMEREMMCVCLHPFPWLLMQFR